MFAVMKFKNKTDRVLDIVTSDFSIKSGLLMTPPTQLLHFEKSPTKGRTFDTGVHMSAHTLNEQV